MFCEREIRRDSKCQRDSGPRPPALFRPMSQISPPNLAELRKLAISCRLIFVCHKNDCNFQYWLSSHICLSQELLQFSILAFVSFMLVTRTTANLNVGFRLIYACHKNDCNFQYWLSSHLCLSQE